MQYVDPVFKLVPQTRSNFKVNVLAENNGTQCEANDGFQQQQGVVARKIDNPAM